MIVVNQLPKAIARPSTIRKARRDPMRIWTCFAVLLDNRRIDIWVLSPSSAAAIVISGMIRSSMMSVTLL